MLDTINDLQYQWLEKQTGLSGNYTVADLWDAYFEGDVVKLGSLGAAIVKHWGESGDSVAEAEIRHYREALEITGGTLQDLRYAFYSNQDEPEPPIIQNLISNGTFETLTTE